MVVRLLPQPSFARLEGVPLCRVFLSSLISFPHRCLLVQSARYQDGRTAVYDVVVYTPPHKKLGLHVVRRAPATFARNVQRRTRPV